MVRLSLAVGLAHRELVGCVLCCEVEVDEVSEAPAGRRRGRQSRINVQRRQNVDPRKSHT